jgi:predicted ATPase/signal transduction histidine kinase
MFTIGAYTLTSQLHQGRETAIHRGHRTIDGAPIVAKTLRTRLPTPLQIARMRHEYALLIAQRSPMIVRVHELVEQGSALALIMEDLGGVALSQLLRAREFTLHEGLDLALGLAGAIAAIHEQGILHRDIKPQNFVVHPDTLDIKLIDFGIATRLVGGSAARLRPDALEGTVAYMSPEQTGRTSLAVDQRSDLYSLGLTLFQLFTRVHPFDTRDPLELVHAQIARVPPPMHDLRPTIPPQLSRIVAKLLAKDPDGRYQTARGLIADLEGLRARSSHEPPLSLDFALGSRDRGARLRRPRLLPGGDEQRTAALAALDRAWRGGARLLLLRGPAGVGKSAFMDRTSEQMAALGATRCAGKCDQVSIEMPHAPIVAALRDLSEQTEALSGAELADLRRRLHERLGDDARVMVELLPELARVLGPTPPLRELPPPQAKTRFYRALRGLLHAFTGPGRALVLCLEDLQWADPASIELLCELVGDHEGLHLLVLASVRDGELPEGHPLPMLLRHLQRHPERLDELDFGPLDLAGTLALIADILHSEPTEVASLAELIFPKTLGNPFFIEQFLQSAHERGILCLDGALGRWVWDAEALAATVSTDNVIELMLARLHRLAPEVQRLLQIAACVGHRFELRTLARTLAAPLHQVLHGLGQALRSGLVVPVAGEHRLLHENQGDGCVDDRLLARLAEQGVTYRFLHDRVQQAAYGSLAEHDRLRVHHSIGRGLQTAESAELGSEQLFELLSHFNRAIPLFTDESARLELARLNLVAGVRARESVAFLAAAAYLRQGLALLPADAWTRDYALRFELGTLALTCESLYVGAALDEAELERLATHAASPHDQARVDHIRVQYDIIRGRPAQAILAGLRALAALGIVIPETEAACAPRLPPVLASVRTLMRGRSADELLAAPPVSSPDIALAIGILADLSSPTNLSRPALYALIIATQTELSLIHGPASISSYSYMVYAYLLATTHREYAESREVGRFALALLERSGAAEVACKTRFVFGCFAHFSCPLQEVVAQFDAAHQVGLRTGDAVYLSYACSHMLLARLNLGDGLGDLDTACGEYLALLRRTQVASSLAVQQVARQFIACLQGRTADTSTLSGPGFDAEAFLAAAEASSLSFAVRWQLLARLELLVVFGHHALALAALRLAQQRIGEGLSFYFTTKLPLLAALTLAANCNPTPEDPQTAVIAEIERHRAQLGEWAAVCPENYAAMQRLVEAELARLTGAWPEAGQRYEQAIALAEAHGHVALCALAHERCGEYYLGKGLTRVARGYLREAYATYQRWEAHAKTRQMLDRYPDMLSAHRIAELDGLETWHTSDGSSSSSNPGLDLSTAFKAAQALASEMNLERLLAKIVPIAIENSGAERGVLLLASDAGELRPIADFDVRGAPSGRSAAPLPLTVARAVYRTATPVVLGDAAVTLSAFRDDPYIRDHQVRSLLCVPLVHQGKPLGVLYLENSLTAGVFAPQHIHVLHVLATQAAIGIENARLYSMLAEANRALEQRVHDRTAELSRTLEHLQTAQGQLVEAEKMAALGTLVAGVAHEINTPVGVSVTAASVLLERSEGLLEAYQTGGMTRSDLERYIDYARQSSTMLLTNLKRAADLIASFKQVAVDQSSEEHRDFLVRTYMEHVLLSLRPELKRTRHRVSILGDPDLRIRSYPGALSQIITNLVMNSIIHAYGPEDAGEIRLAFHTDDDHIVVEYSDDGRGVDPAVLARIFDPFFTTRRDLGGSGLGLHIVYNLVTQRLGGTIRCDSAPGQGTRFTFTLAAESRAFAGPPERG